MSKWTAQRRNALKWLAILFPLGAGGTYVWYRRHYGGPIPEGRYLIFEAMRLRHPEMTMGEIEAYLRQLTEEQIVDYYRRVMLYKSDLKKRRREIMEETYAEQAQLEGETPPEDAPVDDFFIRRKPSIPVLKAVDDEASLAVEVERAVVEDPPPRRRRSAERRSTPTVTSETVDDEQTMDGAPLTPTHRTVDDILMDDAFSLQSFVPPEDKEKKDAQFLRLVESKLHESEEGGDEESVIRPRHDAMDKVRLPDPLSSVERELHARRQARKEESMSYTDRLAAAWERRLH